MKKNKVPKYNQEGKKNPSVVIKVADPAKWNYCYPLALIVLISFIVYLPILHNGFVWDDEEYIQNNPLINSINLKEIFSQYLQGNYHPITILILAIEYHFFGLNETAYHVVNLLLHLLNVILVFYVVFHLCNHALVALITALLFGIHPIHVESVAWAAQLKDLLYAFFFLWSYLFYLKYLKGYQKSNYVFALMMFILALLSKAMAASLPMVMLLTDYFRGRKINVKTVLEKVPFFLLSLILGIIAIFAQKTSNAIQDTAIYSIPQQLVFACYGFITYLIKLILPLQLSAFYPYPVINKVDIPIQYLIYVFLFLGLAISVFYFRRIYPKIFFGMSFFAISIFLVLQLLPVGGAIMADRYSYIPSIGIYYLAGEGISILWSKKLKWIAIIVLSVITIFFSVNTYLRCSVWKNGMTLWSDVISKYQTIPLAYDNRGIIYYNEKKYDQAIKDYSKAIDIDPGYSSAYNNRGVIFMIQQKNDKALIDLNKAIELNNDYEEAYFNRGLIFYYEKRYKEAISNYSLAS